jgi:hypothetical protein
LRFVGFTFFLSFLFNPLTHFLQERRVEVPKKLGDYDPHAAASRSLELSRKNPASGLAHPQLNSRVRGQTRKLVSNSPAKFGKRIASFLLFTPEVRGRKDQAPPRSYKLTRFACTVVAVLPVHE